MQKSNKSTWITTQTSYVAAEHQLEFELCIETKKDGFESHKDLNVVDKYLFISIAQDKFKKGELNHSPDQNELADLWDAIMGYYPTAGQEGQNLFVHYLTEDSCEMILTHWQWFKDGIDFSHLPTGFFLTKNHKTGQRDVLDYNPFDADQSVRHDLYAIPLPLDATPFEEIEKELGEDFKSLSESERDCFNLLDSKRHDGHLVLCTQEDLWKTFYNFVLYARENNLSFDDWDFEAIAEIKLDQGAQEALVYVTDDLYDARFVPLVHQHINPILLISRWKQVISNRHLDEKDLEIQWLNLPKIPLTKGCHIRPITDHLYSHNPCRFLIPEMNLHKIIETKRERKRLNRLYNYKTSSPWREAGTPYDDINLKQEDCQKIRPLDFRPPRFQGVSRQSDDPVSCGMHHIHQAQAIKTEEDFWRYLAHQPRRHDIHFYQQCLEKAKEIDWGYYASYKQNTMFYLLAGATTGDHYRPDPGRDQQNWDRYCQEMKLFENTVFSHTKNVIFSEKGYEKNCAQERLVRMDSIPNIAFLTGLLAYMKEAECSVKLHHIPLGPPERWVEIHHELDQLHNTLKVYRASFYQGAQFYLNEKDQWNDFKIEQYIKLQNFLCSNTRPSYCLDSYSRHCARWSSLFTDIIWERKSVWCGSTKQLNDKRLNDEDASKISNICTTVLSKNHLKQLTITHTKAQEMLTAFQGRFNLTVEENQKVQYFSHHNASEIIPHALSSVLSTFGIRTTDQIQAFLNQVSAKTPDCLVRLEFILILFQKAKRPCQLEMLYELMEWVNEDNEQKAEEAWQEVRASVMSRKDVIRIIDRLDKDQQFAGLFPEGYLREQKNVYFNAINGIGLRKDQEKQLQSLGFSLKNYNRIVSIEKTMLSQNPRINIDHPELIARLNDQFYALYHLLTPTDFDDFIDELAHIKEIIWVPERLGDLLEKVKVAGHLMAFHIICNKSLTTKPSKHTLLHQILVYVQHIPFIYQTKWLAVHHLPQLQELMAQLTLRLTREEIQNSEESFSSIQNIMQTLDRIVIRHPQVKTYLFKSIQYITPKKGVSYLDQSTQLFKLFEQLSECFSNENQESMEILYVLLASSIEDSRRLLDLRTLLEKLSGYDHPCRYFMLSFVSNLWESQHSTDQIEQFIDLCLKRSDYFDLLTTYCNAPPYPSIETLIAWFLKEDLHPGSFVQSYKAFTLQPFKRCLNHAFNTQDFERQRNAFTYVGSDPFTQEVCDSFDAYLNENRIKSMIQLRQEVVELRKKELSLEEKRKLLSLVIEYLARTACEHDGSAQELNATQVMAVYAMFIKQNFEIFSQMETGSGKSRCLTVLLACEALRGKTCDLIASHSFLAERDFLKYRLFLKSLGVKSALITRNTPSMLYQKRGGVNFSDDNDLLLLRSQSMVAQNPFAYLDEEETNRVVGVDEGDYFKHDQSKNAYNYATRSRALKKFSPWIYKYLVQFMKLYKDQEPEFSELVEAFMKHVKIHEQDPSRWKDLKELQNNNPKQCINWLRSAHVALRMKKDEDYIVTDESYPVVDEKGLTRYTRLIIPLNKKLLKHSTFANGVQQCLCEIENQRNDSRHRFVILPENTIRHTSYPRSFLSYYSKGKAYYLSGTARAEGPLADPDINIDNTDYMIVPSHQTSIRKDYPIWVSLSFEEQVACIVSDIRKAHQEKKAFFLVCRNDGQQKRMYEALHDKCEMIPESYWQSIDSLTPDRDKKERLQKAGQPGYVTITTLGEGARGINISSKHMSLGYTFLPTIYDEIQIKGRSGRFGESGDTQLYLNASEEGLNARHYDIKRVTEKRQFEIEMEAIYSERIYWMFSDWISSLHETFFPLEKGFLKKVVPEESGKSALETVKSLIYGGWNYLIKWLTPEDPLEATNQIEEKQASINEQQEVAEEEWSQAIENWELFLDGVEKDWSSVYEALIRQAQSDDKTGFLDTFKQFKQNSMTAFNNIFKTSLTPHDLTKDTCVTPEKYYKSLIAYRQFLQSRSGKNDIEEQEDYHPRDAGQARIYQRLFAQTIAALRGKRRWFDNTRAWIEGRGSLFPDKQALLYGERPLFANTRNYLYRHKEPYIIFLIGVAISIIALVLFFEFSSQLYVSIVVNHLIYISFMLPVSMMVWVTWLCWMNPNPMIHWGQWLLLSFIPAVITAMLAVAVIYHGQLYTYLPSQWSILVTLVFHLDQAPLYTLIVPLVLFSLICFGLFAKYMFSLNLLNKWMNFTHLGSEISSCPRKFDQEKNEALFTGKMTERNLILGNNKSLKL